MTTFFKGFLRMFSEAKFLNISISKSYELYLSSFGSPDPTSTFVISTSLLSTGGRERFTLLWRKPIIQWDVDEYKKCKNRFTLSPLTRLITDLIVLFITEICTNTNGVYENRKNSIHFSRLKISKFPFLLRLLQKSS